METRSSPLGQRAADAHDPVAPYEPRQGADTVAQTADSAVRASATEALDGDARDKNGSR